MLTIISQTWDKDTLRPLTIRQILQAEEVHQHGDIRLNGSDLTRISLVGSIRNVSRQTTNTTFRLDDGTGIIEVKDWNDVDKPTHDENGNPLPGARGASTHELGAWVKVWGSIKFVGTKRHVGVSMMREIKNKNEVQHHLLEATYVHLYFTKGPPEQLNDAAKGGEQMQGVQVDVPMRHNLSELVSPETMRRLQHLSGMARKIYQFLLVSPQSNEGLGLHFIASELRLQMQEVLQCARDLETTSCIYTTVDDETWAVLPE